MDGYKYIQSVGLELEGGWNKSIDNLQIDYSLKKDQFISSRSVGEIVSSPFYVKQEMLNFISDNWPTETPRCCGYHIHIRFNHINAYSKCMELPFYEAFLNAMEKWGNDYPCTNDFFWNRLRDQERFCKRAFRAEQQAACKTKDEARNDDLRCTQLNYCFGLHGTLENRLFPMFICSETAQHATIFYLDFVDNFLSNAGVSDNDYEVGHDLTEMDFSEKIRAILQKKTEVLKTKPFNLYKKQRVIKGYSLSRKNITRKNEVIW